jgi:hypothetical protein
VTFTRRAADELRARIRGVLEAALAARATERRTPTRTCSRSRPRRSAPSTRWRNASATPSRRGRLPPDVSVLDELDGRLWTAEALDAALDAARAASSPRSPSRCSAGAATLLADPFRAEIALAKDAARCAPSWPRPATRPSPRAADPPGTTPSALRRRRPAPPITRPRGAARAGGRGGPPDTPPPGVPAEAGLAAAQGWQAWAARARARPGGDWRSLGGVDLAAVKAALRCCATAPARCGRGAAAPLRWPGASSTSAWSFAPRPSAQAFAGCAPTWPRASDARRLVDFGDLEVHAVRALEHAGVRAPCAALARHPRRRVPGHEPGPGTRARAAARSTRRPSPWSATRSSRSTPSAAPTCAGVPRRAPRLPRRRAIDTSSSAPATAATRRSSASSTASSTKVLGADAAPLRAERVARRCPARSCAGSSSTPRA